MWYYGTLFEVCFSETLSQIGGFLKMIQKLLIGKNKKRDQTQNFRFGMAETQ
jgi:hypothetical protein